MGDTPDKDRYEYDEPIPEPVGVELNASDDSLSEEFDGSKEIKINNLKELKYLLTHFGDGIDITERIELEEDKRLVINSERGISLEEPSEMKAFLMGVNEILYGVDLIPESSHEANILALDHALTSIKIDGYEDHKKVEEWGSHNEINEPEEYDEYVTALASRMFANVDSSVPYGPIMDVNDIAIGVREGRYSLKEAKSRMNQIGVSEELQEPQRQD